MPIAMTSDQIKLLAPNIRSGYRDAFGAGQEVIDRFDISDNALRLAHFMAQVLHESGGLSILFENLNYSAERLPQVWPKVFKPKGPLAPNDYAHNPQKLANVVYGGRMGNTGPDDGFAYRGRGLLQLTGKESYISVAAQLRLHYPDVPDFAAAPDAVIDATWCLRVAGAEWLTKGCNAFADLDSIDRVTRAINGETIGLADRTEWLKRTKDVWH